jgi:hypothetical protein
MGAPGAKPSVWSSRRTAGGGVRAGSGIVPVSPLRTTRGACYVGLVVMKLATSERSRFQSGCRGRLDNEAGEAVQTM